ncbi:MAG: hypothetical protein ACE5HT_17030 [Gemmatimonadales bacterium]
MNSLRAVLIAALVAALDPAGSTALLEAVERYVREVYPFQRDVDRAFAVLNIECVTMEVGLHPSSSQEVFAFPRVAGAPISYALVRVDGTGAVYALDDLDSINLLFREDSNEEPDETARRWAEIFLTIRYFDGHRNQGYPFGIGIVGEPGDVTSRRPLPKTADWAAALATIRQPRLEQEGVGYKLTLYSWTEPSAVLQRHEVWVSAEGIRDYEVSEVARLSGGADLAH